MNEFFEKLERFVDKVIPYLLIVLFGIVIVDIFYHETSLVYHSQIVIADGIIIAFFVADLAFKYNRVRNIQRFFRLYWLDVLAVFPFFLMIRVFEEALLLSERSLSTLRSLFHVGLILEEEILSGEQAATRVARTSELLAKEGRLALISEYLRPLRRLPRMFKAISFYEHPEQKKTLYHKKN